MAYPIFLFILATVLGSVAAAPTARPPPQCTLVLPPPSPSSSSSVACQSIGAEVRRDLKARASALLTVISNNSLNVDRTASCHPDYAILSENERGSNTSIDPDVTEHDLTEISRAYDQFNSCFLPKLKNLSDIEEELYKRNNHFQFYLELDSIRGAVVKLVHILRRLIKDDSTLSSGPLCIIPTATCVVPYYPTTRNNSTPLTDFQVRIQHLDNVMFSIKRYANKIHDIGPTGGDSYWRV